MIGKKLFNLFSIINDLKLCSLEDGGFGGNLDSTHSHILTTFAAICAIACLGTDDAYSLVDRSKVYYFLKSLWILESGSFRVHFRDGESDLRAIYAALAIMDMLNLRLEVDQKAKLEKFIFACQTYEGGFGAIPGAEAHGGYTFCGVASLYMLGHRTFNREIKRWSIRRQMSSEGGFQGRSHKLVDSCYSYWMGGLFPIIEEKFNAHLLVRFILNACQHVSGGICDRPDRY